MYQQIKHYVASIADEIMQNRRTLHQIPETAWTEVQTSAFIAAYLKNLGYTVYEQEAVGGHKTGVIAELSTGDGPVIAMRFDIDALANGETESPDHYPNQEGFASTRPGFMHACGHDGHAAIGLGCAKVLKQIASALKGTIRLIFQPAEEGCMGSRAITNNGWLDDVDYYLAGHIVPHYFADNDQYDKAESDTWDVIPVVGSLATTKINVSFHGRSCHGATPEKGVSVIPAVAASVLAMNGIPRHSEGATFLNIGKIQAGEGRNILAETGYMELEVRGETTALNQYMEDHAVAILNAQADMFGCEVDVDILGRCPSLMSSPELYEPLCALWKQQYGTDSCSRHGLPSTTAELHVAPRSVVFRASEDASIMMERVKEHGGQAVYLEFPADTTTALHKPDYDFNESVLPRGVLLYASAVYHLAQK